MGFDQVAAADKRRSATQNFCKQEWMVKEMSNYQEVLGRSHEMYLSFI
jgi:hypothetical protein